MSKTRLEARRPPTNKAPRSSALSQLEFAFRRFLDLQVHTVLRDITPWLAMRHGSVLDVGCGDQPYRRLLPKDCKYFGLDWDGSKSEFSVTENSDVTYFNGDKFPFPENCFNSVFHTEVLEHVKRHGLLFAGMSKGLEAGR